MGLNTVLPLFTVVSLGVMYVVPDITGMPRDHAETVIHDAPMDLGIEDETPKEVRGAYEPETVNVGDAAALPPAPRPTWA